MGEISVQTVNTSQMILYFIIILSIFIYLFTYLFMYLFIYSFIYSFIYLFIYVRGLLEKYPTFGREKETGLLGALDT